MTQEKIANRATHEVELGVLARGYLGRRLERRQVLRREPGPKGFGQIRHDAVRAGLFGGESSGYREAPALDTWST